MEWKILEGTPIQVQTTLNQWRHHYFIHIHGYSTRDKFISILLTREKKDG